MRVVHTPRHRDGTRFRQELDAEAAELERYVERHAANRRLQMFAFGARIALDWVRLRPWEGGELNPMRMLSLTEFALKLRGRKPVNRVPEFVQRRQDASARRKRR